MTLNGAIMQLVEIWNHPMCPVIFKPALNKVIETISELEEKPQPSKEVTTIADHAIPDESISRQRAVAAAKEPVNPMYTWAATSIKEIETVSSLVKSITKQVQDAIAGRIEQLPPAQLGANLAEVGTDCISRQAAIDALNKLSESTYEVDYGVVDCDDAINAIAALPPVTPKQSLDIDKVSKEVLNAISKWLDSQDDKHNVLDVIKDVLQPHKGKE